jgi:tetratricopeptide (TPR) repeat protein
MNQDRVKMLEQFARDDPKDPFPLYALALEHQTDEPQKACGYFELTLALDSQYLPAYYPYATLLIRCGDNDQARDIFTRGINLARLQHELKTLAELKSAYDGHFN